MAEEKLIGEITHYFGKISVGIIKLSEELKVGDTIHIKGHASDFTQSISSMQVEHVEVNEAELGDMVGIKIDQKVHEHDSVYKVED